MSEGVASAAALWLLALLALALALGPRPAGACMCQPSHPQEQFCRADFAVLAEVVSSQEEGLLRRYQVAVKRTFKGGSAARILLKEAGVVTPVMDSLCGAALKAGPGSVYLLMGRVYDSQPRVSLCDAPTPWRQVTVRQRKGLRQQYGHSCGCKPVQCPWWRGSEAVDDCLVAHSVCSPHPQHRQRRQHRCNWLRGRVLDACLRKAGVANVDGEHSWWLLRADKDTAGAAKAPGFSLEDKRASHADTSTSTSGLQPDP